MCVGTRESILYEVNVQAKKLLEFLEIESQGSRLRAKREERIFLGKNERNLCQVIVFWLRQNNAIYSLLRPSGTRSFATKCGAMISTSLATSPLLFCVTLTSNSCLLDPSTII